MLHVFGYNLHLAELKELVRMRSHLKRRTCRSPLKYLPRIWPAALGLPDHPVLWRTLVTVLVAIVLIGLDGRPAWAQG
jgi:hypothetical protein